MLRRLIGVLLVFGGGDGLLKVVNTLSNPLSSTQVFANILFFLLFTWAIITGILVIENQSKGWLWAKILFLIQIPIVKTSFINYKFMVGLDWSADFATTQITFRYSSGADYSLDLFTNHALSLGVNIVALILFLLIWRRE